jgi:hypothetical protein
MKINKSFSPITVTIEYEDELNKFIQMVRQAMRFEDDRGFRFGSERTQQYHMAKQLYERLNDK